MQAVVKDQVGLSKPPLIAQRRLVQVWINPGTHECLDPGG
jgi:hypothetical protein